MIVSEKGRDAKNVRFNVKLLKGELQRGLGDYYKNYEGGH